MHTLRALQVGHAFGGKLDILGETGQCMGLLCGICNQGLG